MLSRYLDVWYGKDNTAGWCALCQDCGCPQKLRRKRRTRTKRTEGKPWKEEQERGSRPDYTQEVPRMQRSQMRGGAYVGLKVRARSVQSGYCQVLALLKCRLHTSNVIKNAPRIFTPFKKMKSQETSCISFVLYY